MISVRAHRLLSNGTQVITTACVRFVNSGSFFHVKKIGIIGAGVAGLQAAKTLTDAGFECTVYDKAEKVGGLWQSNYSSYGLQVPKQLYEFPDFKFDAPTGSFPNGAEVQQYIEKYTNTFHLEKRIKLNTIVDKIEEVSNSNSKNDLNRHQQWLVTTRNVKSNEMTSQLFDYLVVSTGMYSTPNIPIEFKQMISQYEENPNTTALKCIHSSQFTSKDMALNKHVVVVGGGKSALDIIVESAKVSKRSTLVFSQPHWGAPRKVAGLIPFQYVFLSRFGQALVCWFKGTFPNEIGGNASVNTMHSILKNAMKPIFSIVEALFAYQLGQYGKYRPKDDIVSDFYGYAQVLNSDFKVLLQSKQIDIIQDRVVKFDMTTQDATDNNTSSCSTSVVCKHSGQNVPCDLLILSTGFKKNYNFLPADIIQKLNIESDGLYLYRHCLPAAVENLAFIGSEIATISNITTYKIQSEWLSRLLTNQMPRPSKTKMLQEIESLKQWKRSWMPFTANRASLVLLHQIHYHDSLLRDMDIPHRRKGMNVLAELFMPYQAGDYDGLSHLSVPTSATSPSSTHSPSPSTKTNTAV